MRWWRCSAVSLLGAASATMALAPSGYAIDDCGVGMYYNNAAGQCESWVATGLETGWNNGWNYDPAVPVPVPGIGIGWDPSIEANFFSDLVPNINVGLPRLGVPALAPELRGDIPDVRVPDVAPDLRVPDVRVPDVVPDVRVPDVRVPEVRAPEIRAPEVRVPEIHGRR